MERTRHGENRKVPRNYVEIALSYDESRYNAAGC